MSTNLCVSDYVDIYKLIEYPKEKHHIKSVIQPNNIEQNEIIGFFFVCVQQIRKN